MSVRIAIAITTQPHSHACVYCTLQIPDIMTGLDIPSPTCHMYVAGMRSTMTMRSSCGRDRILGVLSVKKAVLHMGMHVHVPIYVQNYTCKL